MPENIVVPSKVAGKVNNMMLNYQIAKSNLDTATGLLREMLDVPDSWVLITDTDSTRFVSPETYEAMKRGA